MRTVHNSRRPSKKMEKDSMNEVGAEGTSNGIRRQPDESGVVDSFRSTHWAEDDKHERNNSKVGQMKSNRVSFSFLEQVLLECEGESPCR
jgi:hypothetical protein